MKAKLLLAILPALAFLAGCSGETKPKEFLETATACSEIFGDGEAYAERKGTRRLDDGDFEDPVIYGVQHKAYTEGGNNYLAIRYIAEVVSIEPVLTWTRAATQVDGTEVKKIDDQNGRTVCTKFYRYLLAEDDTTPIYPDEGFEYFVVYTMYNIPNNATNQNTFMMAYLTASDPAEVNPHESVSSLAGISQIKNGGEKFTVEADIDSYFMAGIIAGSAENTVLELESDGDNNGKIIDVHLNKNDTFGFFNLTSTNFNYFAYSKSSFNIQGGSIATEVAGSSFFKLNDTYAYSFWINTSDELYVGIKKIYDLDLGSFFIEGQVIMVHSWREGESPYDIQDKVLYNGVGSVAPATCALPTNADKVMFVRLKPGETTYGDNWCNVERETYGCGTIHDILFSNTAILKCSENGESKTLLGLYYHAGQLNFSITSSVESGKAIYLIGDMNGWKNGLGASSKLAQGSNNVWSITMSIPEGKQQFKFVIASTDASSSTPDGDINWTSLNANNREITVIA